MTPHVRAAIEHCESAIASSSLPHAEKVLTLCRYLRTLADPTPLTPDLLRERGWGITTGPGGKWKWYAEKVVATIDMMLESDGVLTMFWHNDFDRYLEWPRPIRTVGDLRRLEELLESEVKDGSKTHG